LNEYCIYWITSSHYLRFNECYRYWIDEASAKTVDQRVQKGLFLFACTNSCMNPIVYGYFNFRSGRGSGYRVPWQRAGPQVRDKSSIEVESAGSFPRFPSEKNPGTMQVPNATGSHVSYRLSCSSWTFVFPLTLF